MSVCTTYCCGRIPALSLQNQIRSSRLELRGSCRTCVSVCLRRGTRWRAPTRHASCASPRSRTCRGSCRYCSAPRPTMHRGPQCTATRRSASLRCDLSTPAQCTVHRYNTALCRSTPRSALCIFTALCCDPFDPRAVPLCIVTTLLCAVTHSTPRSALCIVTTLLCAVTHSTPRSALCIVTTLLCAVRPRAVHCASLQHCSVTYRPPRSALCIVTTLLCAVTHSTPHSALCIVTTLLCAVTHSTPAQCTVHRYNTALCPFDPAQCTVHRYNTALCRSTPAQCTVHRYNTALCRSTPRSALCIVTTLLCAV